MEIFIPININQVPSSAKNKYSHITTNNPFYQINKPKSQTKRKTCKDKLDEGNNNNKKSISLNHNCKITNENVTNNYSNMGDQKIKAFNKQIKTINQNQIQKNLLRNYYDNPNLFKENKEKTYIKGINENKFNSNINIKLLNSKLNEQPKKNYKDKAIITVKNKNEDPILIINNIPKNNIFNTPFLNYKQNLNNWRNKKKMNDNFSLDINNKNNLYSITDNNNKTKNISFFSPNDTSKINEIPKNILTTGRIDGKTKNIYKENKNNNKYKQKNFNKTHHIGFYIKKKIDNVNQINSKSTNNRSKNVFIKPKINDCINKENIINNSIEKYKTNNNIHISINNNNNLKYNEYRNNSDKINNYTYSNKNNCTNSFNNNLAIENDINNNITPIEIYNPKYYKIYKEFHDNIKSRNQQNLIINNNNQIYIDNYNINEKIKNLDLSNSQLQKTYSKNNSYDLVKKHQNNKINNIKALRNMPTSRKYEKNSNEKIIAFNIKDKLYDNNNQNAQENKSNDKIEIININSESTIDKKKENEETIIDNDSEVYSITIKNSINVEKENKSNINKIIKEENKYNKKDNKCNICIANTRDTISIRNLDNNDINENNKKCEKPISELIDNKNLKNNLNQANNNFYFKNYFQITNPGKNYGERKTNQDTPVSFTNLNGIKGFNIFGVLDGHGVNGHYVSKFLSQYLINQIINHKEIVKIRDLNQIYEILRKSNYEILTNIFYCSDKNLEKQVFDVSFSGTTCVLVIQLGKNLICTNVGDSRAILIYDKSKENDLSNTEIFELSHDLKPDLPEEKRRILQMGGTVDQMLDVNGLRGGPARVWAKNKNFPGLAMSRSLGDFKGKQYGIIPLPEIIEYKLDERSKYMVICSDGVWEFLSNKDVMKIGNQFYLQNDIKGFTEKLIKKSENLWEKQDVIVDDITAVVVFF